MAIKLMCCRLSDRVATPLVDGLSFATGLVKALGISTRE